MQSLTIESKKNTKPFLATRFALRELRSVLESVAPSLPGVLGERLLKLYEKRASRAQGRPMLGEHAIAILADLLDIQSERVNSVEVPWFLLYTHSLIVDDLIDSSSKDSVKDIILSQIILDKAISALSDMYPSNTEIFKAFERYRSETWTAVLQEREPLTTSSRTDLLMQQGRKAALAKFCATLLLHTTGRINLSRYEEKGIDALCIGIQLLDDLADIHEDYTEGRRNYLLNQTLSWLNTREVVQETPWGMYQLLFAAVLSQAINSTWALAADYLKNSLELLHSPAYSLGSNYFNNLASNCIRSGNALSSLINKEAETFRNITTLLFKGETALMKEVSSGPIADLLKETLSIVTEGPKASN